jgi:hypothetical protein
MNQRLYDFIDTKCPEKINIWRQKGQWLPRAGDGGQGTWQRMREIMRSD